MRHIIKINVSSTKGSDKKMDTHQTRNDAMPTGIQFMHTCFCQIVNLLKLKRFFPLGNSIPGCTQRPLISKMKFQSSILMSFSIKKITSPIGLFFYATPFAYSMTTH